MPAFAKAMAGKKRKMIGTITDLIFQIGRKYEKGKKKDYKSKICFVCPQCSKTLSDKEDFCGCGSGVILEIEIKKVIIKEKKRKRKIRGE